MSRTRLAASLALAGLALFVAGKEADAPPVMFAAAGVIGAGVALRYDPAFEGLLRRRRWPVSRDLGLWLLACVVAIGIGSAIELLMRLPENAASARIAWGLQLIGSLLPALPILAPHAPPDDAAHDRPLLWPFAAALGAWAIYWTAGWLAWTCAMTASTDPIKVTPPLALWLMLPLALLLAIGAQLWWRALRRSSWERFDDSGLLRTAVTIEIVVIVVLLAGGGALAILGSHGPARAIDRSRSVAWLLSAIVAVPWLMVLPRIRAQAPRSAAGAVAAVVLLIFALGASFALPIAFAQTRDLWEIFLLLFAPAVVVIAALVLKLVPRLVLAALRR